MAEFLDMLLKTVAIMVTIIALTRVLGLRSFSKMSAFDFAVTVAIGSVLAGIVSTPDANVWSGIGAIAALYVWKMALAPLRTHFDWVRRLVDSTPVLVMRNGTILWANMKRAHMTHDDLLAKLRQSNVHDLSQVRAVVVESTGVVSVMHGGPEDEIDDYLLADVRMGEAGSGA
ncbi:hypothetical protein FIU97_03280 [Roseivivax sp. THAF40]|uniref:DUF421 domain-containing protein n=1 Tax=unclassified Roseivivax TaxID=2639302 RepID=UPI001267EBD9|nr:MULTISPECIES: YetF domain-containing protein [unclassified Roseivivax]QFS81790.1 hypothetical protein FIV09_03020 [Roseivivax sp. THAF197b]QFT45590.1 hypothetical protein FIU97_03280 [Roseivivax sp. THAF40]